MDTFDNKIHYAIFEYNPSTSLTVKYGHPIVFSSNRKKKRRNVRKVRFAGSWRRPDLISWTISSKRAK
jgi:hypothetical protein